MKKLFDGDYIAVEVDKLVADDYIRVVNAMPIINDPNYKFTAIIDMDQEIVSHLVVELPEDDGADAT